MEQMIHIYVEKPAGDWHEIRVPEGISLSLMEVLKASDYDILATCGGMALCATCHVQILEGIEKLDEQSDNELDMLDTLPEITDESRLSCQIKLHPSLDGLKLRIFGQN